MADIADKIERTLTGLDAALWKQKLLDLANEIGTATGLGQRHFATHIHGNETLLVTFETVQGIRALSERAQPLGFDVVRDEGWSHLCLISNGDTWFRDRDIYRHFDKLIDDGTFEEYDQVLFYGAGPCGYAATAFSVAAPGSHVVAVQPQATLEARITEWDPRFSEMRRISFTDRYGYAPDMLDAAERAFILYDPREELDAMHAALFLRPNVTRLRMPNMGSALQTRMLEMGILKQTLLLAGRGELDETAFYRLYRARRENVSYLRNLLFRLDGEERLPLVRALCSNVVSRMNAPKFRRRLDALKAERVD